MKNLWITTILLFFIAHAIPVAAQRADPRTTSSPSIGIYAGSGLVIDEGGMAFRGFAAYAPVDPERKRPLGIASSGTGATLFGGIDVAQDFGRLLRVTAGVDLEHRSALYRGDVPGPRVLLPATDQEYPPHGELEMDVSTLALGGSLGIVLFPAEFELLDLGLTAELRGRHLLSSSEEQRVRELTALRAGEEEYLPSPRAAREIDDATSPQIGVRLGFLGEYCLDDDGIGLLRFRVAYEHPLTDLVPSSGWRARAITLSVGVAYRFAGDGR